MFKSNRFLKPWKPHIKASFISFISVMITLSFLTSISYAKSNKSILMENMKSQFDQALSNADVKKAEQIWLSVNSSFEKKFDKMAARALIYGGGSVFRVKQLEQIYLGHPEKFVEMAHFLSTINLLDLTGTSSSTAVGATFSGTIKDKKQQRVVDAKIIIAGQETMTDSNGSFSFKTLPSGSFDIFILAPGYKIFIGNRTINPNSSSKISYRLTANNAKPLMTQKEAQEKVREITSTIKLPTKTVGTETLSGTLLDATTGSPIINAKVIMACESAIKSTSSDKNGKFILHEIPTETCSFSVMQSNASNFTDLYKKAQAGTDRAYSFGAKYNITSKPNHLHENIWKIKSNQLDLGGTVKGVVLNAINKLPVSGAEVVVAARYIGVVSFDGKTAKTDNQGRFEIKFVPEGVQAIDVTKQIFKKTSKKITIVKSKTTELTLLLEPITVGSLTGIALSAKDHKPLAGVKITVGSKTITTDAQGRFTLTDIDAGNVTVGGSKSIFKSTSKTLQLAAAKTINVTLNLEPITQGNISGTALNASSHQPMSGVTITVGEKSVLTDLKGHFVLNKITAGNVSVIGSKSIFKPTTKNIKVIAAQNTTVTLALEPITVGNISGLILNANNQQPITGVRINLGTKTAITDSLGKFTLSDISAGLVGIQANKEVFKPAGKDIKVIAAKTINVILKLEPITVGNITGVVLNATTKKPLAGVKINAVSQTVITNAQGQFSMIKISAGNVSIQANKPVFFPETKNIKVEAAKSVSLTIRLKPITVGIVTGLVVNASNQQPLAGVKVSTGALSTVTDANGQFTFSKVPKGALVILGSKAIFESATKNIKVSAAKTVKLKLILKPITIGTVNGTVLNATTQKPVVGASVTSGNQSTQSDAQGRFTFTKLSAGDVLIEAAKPVYSSASKHIMVAAAKTVKMTIKLKPITVGTISGSVFNATNKKPIAGAKVIAGTLSTSTDNSGHFVFEKVNLGALSVQASKAVFVNDVKNINIKAAKTTKVKLLLIPITTANLDGQIIDKKNGKPIANARVSVATQSTVSSRDGRYSLQKIASGKITVMAQHPDFTTGRKLLHMQAGKLYHQKIILERRREDVVALEKALNEKGTVDLYGIHFGSGKEQFLPSSLSTLQAVSEVIKSSSGKIFEIAGHTDSDGNANYNQNLSERRANTVIKWLVQNGVSRQQLKAKGYGEGKPLVPNNNEAGKALNRRVQLRIIQ